MAGTFEEARAAYTKFYSLDFRKYGVDIPQGLMKLKKKLNFLIMLKNLCSWLKKANQQDYYQGKIRK